MSGKYRERSFGFTSGFDCWECGHFCFWEDGWTNPYDEDTSVCDDCVKGVWDRYEREHPTAESVEPPSAGIRAWVRSWVRRWW